MANSSISLLDLDFNNLKTSFKTFLAAQPQFKDYDFEGSNINVLLDLLSYNTYKNSFYYNMLISEAFLDSAQLKNSIISHAKDLNYLPRSRKSAQANVTVTFEASGESAPYIIPKGSPFTTLVKNQAFTFTLPEATIVDSANTTYEFTTKIYEGYYVTDAYVVNSTDEIVRYKLTNNSVDTDSITVTVYEDGAETGDVYKAKETLLDLDETSKVFFIQAVDDGYYEILFGDNFLGKKPKIGSTIEIEYRVSSGIVANGAKLFSVDFDPTGVDELTSTPEIVTNDIAQDGVEPQSIESIRLYAPRYFASQQRAVAVDDYASIILSKFSGTVDDVIVYGGETVEPKRYGRVLVCIKPSVGTIAADFIKDQITSYMLNYVSLPTRIVITDPEYFYLFVSSTIQYNTAATNKTAAEIRGLATNAMVTYGTDYLSKFGADFRYSKFIEAIDDADASIISNDTTTRLIKRLYPTPNQYSSFEIDYNNQLISCAISLQVISSSSFTFISDDGVYYPYSYIRDDKEGNLQVYTTINNEEVILNDAIGTIDYTTGKVIITRLLTSTYGDYLSIYANVRARDIIMNKNNILFVETSDITATVTGTIN